MKFGKALLATSILSASTLANATAILTLDDLNDAAAATVVTDNGAGDAVSTVGIIHSALVSSNWNVVTATGFSSADNPSIVPNGYLDLSYAISGTGDFSLTFSDDFTVSELSASSLLNGNYNLIGGTATITMSVWDDSDLVSQIQHTFSSGFDGYSLRDSFDFSSLGDSNLKIGLDFSTDQDAKFSITSGDLLLTKVPEPGTLALLGLGLAGLGVARRKQA